MTTPAPPSAIASPRAVCYWGSLHTIRYLGTVAALRYDIPDAAARGRISTGERDTLLALLDKRAEQIRRGC